jgi:hypothetical protein
LTGFQEGASSKKPKVAIVVSEAALVYVRQSSSFSSITVGGSKYNSSLMYYIYKGINNMIIFSIFNQKCWNCGSEISSSVCEWCLAKNIYND